MSTATRWDDARLPLSLGALMSGIAVISIVDCVVLQALRNAVAATAVCLWVATTLLPAALAALAIRRYAEHLPQALLALAAAVTAFVCVDLAIFPAGPDVSTEIVERVRSKSLIAAAFFAVAWAHRGRRRRASDARGASTPTRNVLGESDFVHAAGNYVEIAVGGKKTLLRHTLKQAVACLGDEHWLQVHRSWAVRVDAVVAVQRCQRGRRHLLLRSGLTVPVGRSYRHVFDRIDEALRSRSSQSD